MVNISQLTALITSSLVIICMTVLLFHGKIDQAAAITLITVCLADIFESVKWVIGRIKNKGSEK